MAALEIGGSIDNVGKLSFYHKEAKDDLFTQQTHVLAAPIYVDKSGKPRYFTDAITGGRATTQKERSKTFPGIAQAMAEQWGGV